MDKTGERAKFQSRPLVIVLALLGVLLPAGFYGLKVLHEEIQEQQARTRGVIIDFKTETIGEIRAGKSTTVDEIKKLDGKIVSGFDSVGSPGTGTDVSSGLEALKKTIDEIHSEQKAIAERLDALRQRPTAVPVEAPAPGARPDRLNKTIYFPLAVAKGAMIDRDLAAILPDLKHYAAGRPCVVNVLGFSDTLGNDKSNLVLSQERAEYVAAKLRDQGMVVRTVKGWGERWLDVHTIDGVKNDNNRRVVIEMDCTVDATPKNEPATKAAVPSTS